jgi:hypothetical protein
MERDKAEWRGATSRGVEWTWGMEWRTKKPGNSAPEDAIFGLHVELLCPCCRRHDIPRPAWCWILDRS